MTYSIKEIKLKDRTRDICYYARTKESNQESFLSINLY
jgi:hypothetical protein